MGERYEKENKKEWNSAGWGGVLMTNYEPKEGRESICQPRPLFSSCYIYKAAFLYHQAFTDSLPALQIKLTISVTGIHKRHQTDTSLKHAGLETRDGQWIAFSV